MITAAFTVFLLVVLFFSARYLWRLERAEAETARLERMLAAARFRSDVGENEYRL